MPPAAPRAASLRAKLLVNTVLGLGFMLIAVPVITRLWLHEWLSFAWVVLLFLHIVFAWGWVVNVSRRAVQSVRSFTSMRWQVQLNFLWDVTLYVTTAIAMVSGVLVSMFALPAIGIKMPHDRFWAILHVSSSEWLMAMVGIHLALHWSWLKTTVVRLFTGTLGGAARRADGWTWWARPMAIVTAVSVVASLATWGLGATPIATAMRVAPPRRRAAAVARPAPPAVVLPVAPAGGAPGTSPASTTSASVSPSSPTAAPSPAGSPASAATTTTATATPAPKPRPKRPPMSLPRRILRAAGILGRWMGIPFVLAMAALWFAERKRQATKGGRGALALDAAD